MGVLNRPVPLAVRRGIQARLANLLEARSVDLEDPDCGLKVCNDFEGFTDDSVCCFDVAGAPSHGSIRCEAHIVPNLPGL
jgi:hypothetical protein